MIKKSCLSSGFTLIELMVVIAIIVVFAGAGVAKYNQFNQSQILIQAANELKNNLRFAQEKALAGEKPRFCTVLNGYKVAFYSESSSGRDSYKIIAHCSPNDIQYDVKTVELPSIIRFSLPLADPVFFKVLAHGVEAERTITLKGKGGETQTIKVTISGEIK